MALATASDRHPAARTARLVRAPLSAWCALGVALFAGLVFWFDPTRLTTSLGDTDDATRLIEVRELIGGAPWFDMTLDRFGGAQPLVSHWSRLVDLPIAALLSGFRLVLPAGEAELAVRALWPLILLWALVYLLAREVEIRGGRTAALLSIALSVTCLIGVVQFLPGRIDHHNAIILCAVVGILRLARSFDDAGAGWSAGVLLGLSVAIGYEALALVAASLGAATLYGMLPRRSLLGPSRAAVTFAATLAVALALTTAPEALFVSRCDALSFNLMLLAIAGALGVTIVQAFEERLWLAAKFGLLAATGLAGLALFWLAEPVCLEGPFAQVDPALIPVWLGSVSETRTILSMGRELPLLGSMALLYFAAGIYCGLKLMPTDRGDTLRYNLVALLIAVPLSFWQIKLLPYATFLPIPLLAICLAQPPQAARATLAPRTLALLVLGAVAMLGVAAWLLMSLAAPSAARMKARRAPIESCQSTAAILPLAHLPKGLFVADVNLGPYIVALTYLDALSAPYHRLDKSILEANRILHAPPAEAEASLRRVGARYVILCKGLNSTKPQGPVPPDALQTLLLAGKTPAFLEPVPLADPTPLKVWRLKR